MTDKDETKRLYYMEVRCCGYYNLQNQVVHAHECPLKWLKTVNKPYHGHASHGISEECKVELKATEKARKELSDRV